MQYPWGSYNHACCCSTTSFGERKENGKPTKAEQMCLCHIIIFCSKRGIHVHCRPVFGAGKRVESPGMLNGSQAVGVIRIDHWSDPGAGPSLLRVVVAGASFDYSLFSFRLIRLCCYAFKSQIIFYIFVLRFHIHVY